MPNKKENATEAKFAKNNRRPLINRELNPHEEVFHSAYHAVCVEPVRERQEVSAVPLFKQLVGAQRDGVSVDNASLLQRQYDEEFGVVDPASDIHTDPHLLQDALMRRAMENKVAEPSVEVEVKE